MRLLLQLSLLFLFPCIVPAQQQKHTPAQQVFLDLPESCFRPLLEQRPCRALADSGFKFNRKIREEILAIHDSFADGRYCFRTIDTRPDGRHDVYTYGFVAEGAGSLRISCWPTGKKELLVMVTCTTSDECTSHEERSFYSCKNGRFKTVNPLPPLAISLFIPDSLLKRYGFRPNDALPFSIETPYTGDTLSVRFFYERESPCDIDYIGDSMWEMLHWNNTPLLRENLLLVRKGRRFIMLTASF